MQVQGLGEHDVIAFVQSDPAGVKGGITHFGFRLLQPADIEIAREMARELGATVVGTGEFAPGFPFLNLLDPDGYEIEIWYE